MTINQNLHDRRSVAVEITLQCDRQTDRITAITAFSIADAQ